MHKDGPFYPSHPRSPTEINVPMTSKIKKLFMIVTLCNHLLILEIKCSNFPEICLRIFSHVLCTCMILKIAEQVVKVVIQFLSNRMIQLLHHIDRHKKNYWMKTQYSVILSMITKQFSEYQRMNQKSVWLQMPNHSRDFFCMCSEKIMLYF